MKRRTTLISVITILASLLLVFALRTTGFFENPNKATNNDFARIACWEFVYVAVGSTEATNRQFDIKELTNDDWTRLARTSRGWHGGVDFLVRTNFNIPVPKQIVIACNTEFETTWPTIRNSFKRNPAYSVGYSDGTTGFVSRDQYLALDQTGFVLLSTLVANYSVSKPNE